jgi:hypothetical protein
MTKVMVVALVILAGVTAYADTLVPGSCVIVRGGAAEPTPDCICKVYKTTGNAAQDAYNFAHGLTQTAEIYGQCVSFDCRDYRADQWPILGCYGYPR